MKSKVFTSQAFAPIFCFLVFSFTFVTNLYAHTIPANVANNIEILEQRLKEEEESYKAAKRHHDIVENQTQITLNNLKQKISDEININNYTLEQLRLEISKTNLQVMKLESDRDSVTQNIISGENSIYQLETKLQAYLGMGNTNILPNDKSFNSNVTSLQNSIKYHQKILDINKKRYQVLAKSYDLTLKTLAIIESALNEVQSIVDAHIKVHQIVWQSEQEIKLNNQINSWINKELAAKQSLDSLNYEQLIKSDNLNKYNDLQTEVITAENNRGLLDLELSLLRLTTRFSDITKLFEENNYEEIKNKKYLAERVARLQKEGVSLKALANNKINLLNENVKLLDKQKQAKNISNNIYNDQMVLLSKFNEQYKDFIKVINKTVFQLTSYQDKLNEIYLSDISVRQSLPSSITEWRSLLHDIVAIPYLLSKQTLGAWLQFKNYFDTDTAYKLLNLLFLQISLFALFYLLYKTLEYLKNKYFTLVNKGFSISAFYIIARLFDSFKFIIALIINIYAFFWLANVSGSLIKIFIWLSTVFILIGFIIKICYIFLIENIDEVSGDDRRLYYGLKYALIFGGILSALLVLGQELSLPLNTQIFIDRLSMLFLLAVSYPLIINWQVLPQLLVDNLKPKSYIKRAIWLIGLIVPITILSNAALGIVGYVNLAWKIALAELQLSLVIALWLIFKGLFTEFMEITSRFFIRNITNGWLWTESVLKPLHTVINVLLFASACICLVFIYGWNSGVDLVQVINGIFKFQMINISGVDIYFKDFIIFCVIFSVVLWATKWSREFSYRWLYVKTKDLGVRNSFAVFTQYSVLLIGVIVILKVLRFPTATLTVAIGGLIFFFGFGLRDILSNYISGIILLIERPIRVGDFITIGNDEGKVTKIGMRSLTLQSFDNMEVIVPNTDTITKPLTNWTFNDTIIRMELVLRVAYDENLEKVRTLILSTLSESEDVLSEPESKVYFKEFSDSAVIANIYYYIDLNKTPSRGSVRTQVMLSISRVLKSKKVKVAYPHQTINLEKNCDNS